MKRLKTLIILLAFTPLCLWAREKPNIIFILAYSAPHLYFIPKAEKKSDRKH